MTANRAMRDAVRMATWTRKELQQAHDNYCAVAREAGLEPGYQVIHRPRKRNFFELFDLFDESTDEIRSSLNREARKWLREAGFGLSVPLNLVRESISGQAPRIWLLAPTEMVIR